MTVCICVSLKLKSGCVENFCLMTVCMSIFVSISGYSIVTILFEYVCVCQAVEFC